MLYYADEELTDNQYQQEPTGDLNVQRVLSGNSRCWRVDNKEVVLKKKTLVLSDWSASTWSHQQLSVFKNMLNELIVEGFKIYVWQGKLVGPLQSVEFLNDQESRDNITPVSRDNLTEAVISHLSLPIEQACILDYMQLRSLFNEINNYSDTTLSVIYRASNDKQDMLNLADIEASIFPKEQIINSLKSGLFTPKKIFMSAQLYQEHPEFCENMIKLLVAWSPHAAIYTDRAPAIPPNSILTRYAPIVEKRDASQPGKWKISEDDFISPDVRQPSKNLHLFLVTDSEKSASLISKHPEIEHLIIESSEMPKLVARLQLPQLKTLEVLGSKLDAEFIINLAQGSKNLTKLMLLDLAEISNIERLCLQPLGQIKLLGLSHATVKASFINALLKNNPQLDKIILNSVTIRPDEELVACPHIKIVECHGSTINVATLTKLFPNAKLIAVDHNSALKQELSGEQQIISSLPPEKLSMELSSARQTVHSGQGKNFQSPHYYQGKAQPISIDSNTLNNQTNYVLTKIFYALNADAKDVEPRLYRQKVHDSVVLDKPTAPFLLEPTKPSRKLIDVNIVEHDTYLLKEQIPASKMKDQLFQYGKISIKLTKEWQALPSLSPDEKLWCMHISGIEPKYTQTAYCAATNQYYVRLTDSYPRDPAAADIDFILSYPKLRPQIPEEQEKILQEIKKLRSFGDEALADEEQHTTAEEVLKAMYQQKQGACRHRSAIFMLWMKEKFPQVPVRIIGNDSHMLVEICLNQQWISCDLGGHRVQSLQITEPHNPSRAVEIMHSPQPYKEESSIQGALNPHFITWEAEKTKFESFEHYCQALFKQQGKNLLVQIPVDGSASMLAYLFQHYALASGHNIFYIDSPDAVKCQPPFAYLAPGRQVLIEKDKPGGALYEFLSKEKNPILLINWSKFSPADIVRLNTLIDAQHRRADGIDIPKECVVMGLYFNFNDPRAYKGSDFRRRLQLVTECPFPVNQLASLHAKLFQASAPVVREGDPVVVNLYESPDWEALLIGKLDYDEGGRLIFLRGPLIKAIVNNKNIVINNALPEVIDFLATAQQRGYIEVYGARLAFPKELHVDFNQGYQWNELISPDSCLLLNLPDQFEQLPFMNPELIYTLNPQTLNRFLTSYQVRDNKLFQMPGIIARNAVLGLYLTSPLSTAQWGKLLECLHQANSQVTITVPHHLIDSLPGTLQGLFHDAGTLAAGNLRALVEDGDGKVVITNDIDYEVNLFTVHNNEQELVVLDISDCTTSEVMGSITTTYNNDRMEPEFAKRISFILNQLNDEGKVVILKGNFSRQLVDSLASLCQKNGYWLDEEGNKHTIKGKLVIFSDNQELFKTLPHVTKTPSYNHKIRLLERMFGDAYDPALVEALPQNLSFMDYYTHLRRALQNIPAIESPPGLNSLDLDQAQAIAESFNSYRLQQIQSALTCLPLVVISGPTGVGKSAFIDSVLKKHAHVFNSEEQLDTWARANFEDGKDIVLFIDEANIAGKNWSVFEGLLNHPPSIFYKGNHYPLSPKHKVVFAGNPYEYAGGRNQPALFKHYPTATVKFDFMPPAYIYHQILKPLLVAHNASERYAGIISLALLKVYAQVCQYSDKDVLMTARSLQMITLQIIRAAQLNKGKPTEIVLTNLLAATYLSLPKQFQEPFKEWFLEEFGQYASFINRNALPGTNIGQATTDLAERNFYLTSGRYDPYRQLSAMLEVRALKCDSNNPTIQHCGWGGLIFEGEPGSGKTEFVKAVLQSQRFTEVKAFGRELNENRQIFYHLDPNLSLSKKEAVLMQAFHQGAIVIIDEMNSCLLPERLLNSLLMGRDLENNPATRPGFMLIGTQNSIGLAGRKALSPALQQRLMKANFGPYSHKEIVTILTKSYKIEEPMAEKLASDYLKAREYAITQHKHPIPTFGSILAALGKPSNEASSDLDEQRRRQAVLAANAGGNDTSLATDGHRRNYWYSVGDGLRLLEAVRAGFYQAGDDIRYPCKAPGEEFSYNRQNRNRIFLSDPFYVDTSAQSARDFSEVLLGNIHTITGGHRAPDTNRNFEWTQMPTRLIIPILKGLHWCCVVAEINYATHRVDMTFDDPYGNFDRTIERNLLPEIKASIQVLMRKHDNNQAYNLPDENIRLIPKEIDQQGRGRNGYDCGPIMFSNIRDYVGAIGLTVPDTRTEGHENMIVDIRARDVATYENRAGVGAANVDQQQRINAIKKSLETSRGQLKKLLSEVQSHIPTGIESLTDQELDIILTIIYDNKASTASKTASATATKSATVFKDDYTPEEFQLAYKTYLKMKESDAKERSSLSKSTDETRTQLITRLSQALTAKGTGQFVRAFFLVCNSEAAKLDARIFDIIKEAVKANPPPTLEAYQKILGQGLNVDTSFGYVVSTEALTKFLDKLLETGDYTLKNGLSELYRKMSAEQRAGPAWTHLSAATNSLNNTGPGRSSAPIGATTSNSNSSVDDSKGRGDDPNMTLHH